MQIPILLHSYEPVWCSLVQVSFITQKFINFSLVFWHTWKTFQKSLKLTLYTTYYVILSKGKQTFLTKNLSCYLSTVSHFRSWSEFGPSRGRQTRICQFFVASISSSKLLMKYLISFKAKWQVKEQGKFYTVTIPSDWAGWLPCILLRPIHYFWYGMCVS